MPDPTDIGEQDIVAADKRLVVDTVKTYFVLVSQSASLSSVTLLRRCRGIAESICSKG